jgi:hypothetical protein
MPDRYIEERSGDEGMQPGVGERCGRTRRVEFLQELLTLRRIDIGPRELRQSTFEVFRIRRNPEARANPVDFPP